MNRGPGPEAQELERRARELAKPAQDVGERPEVELVSFTTGATTYALEARYVREIRALEHLARLPGAARPFHALVAIRGEIVPVVAVGELLHGDPTPADGATSLVVVADERAPLGLLAATSGGGVSAGTGDVVDPPAGLLTPPTSLVRGVLRDGTIVLDGDELLHDPRLTLNPPRTEEPRP